MFHLLNCSVLPVRLFQKRYFKKPKETQPEEQVTQEKTQFLADFLKVGKSLSQLPFTSPKFWSCSSENYCTVKSLTVSLLLLLPVLKKYMTPAVSENTCTENSTVGCLICASGRLMRVTHLKPKSKCVSVSGQKTQQWWTGTQHAAIASSSLCSRWPQSGELSVPLLSPFCCCHLGMGLHEAVNWKNIWICRLLTSVKPKPSALN